MHDPGPGAFKLDHLKSIHHILEKYHIYLRINKAKSHGTFPFSAIVGRNDVRLVHKLHNMRYIEEF